MTFKCGRVNESIRGFSDVRFQNLEECAHKAWPDSITLGVRQIPKSQIDLSRGESMRVRYEFASRREQHQISLTGSAKIPLEAVLIKLWFYLE